MSKRSLDQYHSHQSQLASFWVDKLVLPLHQCGHLLFYITELAVCVHLQVCGETK